MVWRLFSAIDFLLSYILLLFFSPILYHLGRCIENKIIVRDYFIWGSALTYTWYIFVSMEKLYFVVLCSALRMYVRIHNIHFSPSCFSCLASHLDSQNLSIASTHYHHFLRWFQMHIADGDTYSIFKINKSIFWMLIHGRYIRVRADM